MKPQQLTYDICRSYLIDYKSTMRPEIFDKLSGYCRSRQIDLLASCTTLSSPALSTLDEYRSLMQVEAFFKKNKSFSDESRCSAAALSSFRRGELLCRITNRRLDHYYIHRSRLGTDMEKKLSRMESDFTRIMGVFGTFLEKLPSLVRVTAGATSTKSRKNSLPYLRISKRPYASPEAQPYLDALSRYFGYGAVKVRPTRANRLEFVPKNCKTYRTIAAEPEGNVFLQLAFDTYIKRRLRRVGIDLTQQSKNQHLARQGSVDGSLATIDMSMASDTVAFNTVAWLVPMSWFRFLKAVRSSRSRGVLETEYAKFSSMGNGCTFGIETLIFVTACRAVGSKRYSVYGDDIIIETELRDDLTTLLGFLGFIVNTEKSHFEGPFRESCGANWYSGIDITPFYVRDIDDRKAMMCHLVNGLATIAKPDGRLRQLLISLIRDQKLPLAPFTESSISGIWVDIQTAKSMKLIRKNIKGKDASPWIPSFRSYIPVAVTGENRDMRSSFLWYLDTLERGAQVSRPKKGSPWYTEKYFHWDSSSLSCVVRTRYSTSSHRFRRKWVHWREPAVGAPDLLYSWSEELTSAFIRP